MATSRVFEQRAVPFSKLHLDTNNPRHEPTEDEPSIISYLVSKEQILPLATDICRRGLSPLERLAAIPHPYLTGHVVMIEGNRRLCAMKLLRDPAKAPAAERKQFKKLADRKPTLPRNLEVAVFESREVANEWVSLKHAGLQGGIGVRSWTAGQTSRFQNSISGLKRPNALALAVLDYAEDAGLLSVAQRSQVAITTVTRYLSNPVVRSALGISSSSELLINVEKSEFDAALSQFLSDISDGTANSRTTGDDRANYGRALISSGLSPSTTFPTSISPTDPRPAPPSSTPQTPMSAPAAKTRNNKNPDHGDRVVRTGYAVHISDPTTKRVFDELREIDAKKFAFGASCLLRLLMERVCRAYASKHGLAGNGDLAPVIGRCANHMEQAGANKTVYQIWRVLSTTPAHYLAPNALGSIVHGGMTPVASELRRGWTDLERGFDHMLNTLK